MKTRMANPIVVAEDKEAAIAQLAEIPSDQLPEGFEVLSVEEAIDRLAEIQQANEEALHAVQQHPDPRFAVSIQDGAMALAKVEELLDFVVPPGTTGRIAFELQFESGRYASLIEGAAEFQRNLLFNIHPASGSASKLTVVE
jgi:hypothetical protein